MSEALLADVRFHRLLLAYDEDLARRERSGRCRRCGGVLHSARYRRKPRGLPPGLGEEYRQRPDCAPCITVPTMQQIAGVRA